MKQRAFKTLEFDKILNKMASYTDSEQVRKKILELEPLDTLESAREAQRETTEAVAVCYKLGNPPINLGVPDITACVKRSEIGGILNTKDFMSVARVLYVARRIKGYLGDADENSEILHALSDSIITNKSLEDTINSIILSETEIADDASHDLSAIRRKKHILNAKIKDSLSTMIRSEAYKKYLQDPIVTIRQDRYVIPVRAEYRGEIPGIVHDSSSSGATLFIEPMSVVNANNEIRELINKEQIEIEKILQKLSAEVSENAGIIVADYNIVMRLDFIFCKAKLAFEYKCTEPVLNDEGIIDLKKARHPLIDSAKVVANDIYLGEKYNTLVVTGPNTGGKTVTLKTIGLFSIMAAAGLHIPANENSRAAVFKKFFADIGDEQSIEQSLSTFSSHMVNIVSILKTVDSDSLALFDELGAGTDPTEGAALAIAVLEYLRSFGATTVATTHYSELKIFALTTDGVENASCEFDIESLRPTYKLLIGVPGKSNAFAISRRLGLDESVLDRANEILSDEDVKFEDVITELEQNRAEAKMEKDRALHMKNELYDLKNEIEKERRKLKEAKANILDEARREAKIIVMDARRESNEIIKELERMRIEGKSHDVGEKIKASRENLKKREDSIDKAMAKSAVPRKTLRKPPKNLKEGDTVRILDMDQLATVIKKPDDKGNVRVQAGILKMNVHISNLEAVVDTSAKEVADRYIKSTGTYTSKTKNVSTEVDVRGQTLDEAIMNVEKFIDDCYLAGISPVTIIHGKGTGVLRAGIGKMLKKHKYVKSQRMGNYGEGEAGVTVVELK
ncbi:MAG: endonuclease MutS2 [Firmicutes bacterium]|nr:endonuclease MutS2 [Bacillota bacterium]